MSALDLLKAHARPMDSAALRPLIAEMREQTASRAARLAMARLALAAGDKFANLTPCGRAAWESFIAEEESIA